jgi:hypothetical protein
MNVEASPHLEENSTHRHSVDLEAWIRPLNVAIKLIFLLLRKKSFKA